MANKITTLNDGPIAPRQLLLETTPNNIMDSSNCTKERRIAVMEIQTNCSNNGNALILVAKPLLVKLAIAMTHVDIGFHVVRSA